LAARPSVAGIELAGTTGANFLTVNPGASLVGMGGTGIAGYPDLSAMTWNPAALGLMNESQLMFTHMPLPNAASQEWMSFGGRTGDAPTRWALSGRYEGDGSFQLRDPLGNLTGTFNSSSLALGVNAARALDRHTVVGMGAKFVNENLGSVAGYGGTFDMGILYHAGPLSLGAATQNMGGSMKYDSLAYSMPLNFGAGLALADVKHGLRVTMDFNHPNAYYEDVRTGAEWIWKQHVALRVGYRQELNAPINDPMNGASFGLGGGGHGLWFDYGFVASADGTTQQRITLRVSPKDWGMSFASDVDDPNSTGGSSPPSPPAASSQPSASASASGAANSAASNSAANSAPAPVAAASPTVAPLAASSSAASSLAPVVSPPASSTSPGTKTVATIASAARSTPEPSTPSPVLTTLVPVTPPDVPAPKPVLASRPASLPAVSAPAPESKPSAAPVTESAGAASPGGAPPAASAPQTSANGSHANTSATPTAAVNPGASATPVVESAVQANGKPVKIHVKKGETLESIAKRFDTTKAAIMMENNLVTEKLHPGQELKIPAHQ
jgi:LysM repeat protein